MIRRAVPAWSSDNPDAAIPARVKLRIFDRQNGKCAICNRKLGMAGEAVEYDHVIALCNGGQHHEDNLQALCGLCHKPKTAQDVAIKSKDDRVRKKHLGLTKKRKMPYRRFNGDPVWPD